MCACNDHVVLVAVLGLDDKIPSGLFFQHGMIKCPWHSFRLYLMFAFSRVTEKVTDFMVSNDKTWDEFIVVFSEIAIQPWLLNIVVYYNCRSSSFTGQKVFLCECTTSLRDQNGFIFRIEICVVRLPLSLAMKLPSLQDMLEANSQNRSHSLVFFGWLLP